MEIAGTRVAPGSREVVELQVARLTTGTWLSLPVEVLHGGRPGPSLWLSGGIHGDELDGMEIIRRVTDALSPRELAGTLFAVPVVNVFGFVAESRYLPDRRDLNRSFPGSRGGSMASRLANLFMTEVVERCQWGIDFHCGSDDRENLPQVRADLDDEETRRVALAFGAPVALHNRPPDGSLRKSAVKAGARVVLYEGGEARRFTPSAITSGVQGVLRVLEELEMLARSGGGSAPGPETLEIRGSRWIRAGRSGILRLDVGIGDRVRKGEPVGTIGDVLGTESRGVKAPEDGIVLGCRVNPLVYQGEGLIHLGTV